MKQFPCVTGSLFLPAFFSFGAVFFLFVSYMCVVSGSPFMGFLMGVFSIGTVAFIIWGWKSTMCKVQIQPAYIICKTLFCADIVMEYEKCTVGMDYHLQRGCKVWWIYLCYGPGPKFDTKKPYNRMNSLKCKPGFIRIMYDDEVYQALIEVLPKKQHTALVTACRCAGLKKY